MDKKQKMKRLIYLSGGIVIGVLVTLVIFISCFLKLNINNLKKLWKILNG